MNPSTDNKKQENKISSTDFDLEKWKKSKHPPNPSRFEEYLLLEDESGFKTKGSDHIFYFDEFGGWYDEWGNYYNQENVPCDPPEYEQEDSEDFEDYEGAEEDLTSGWETKDDGNDGIDDDAQIIYYDKLNGERLENLLYDDTIIIKIRNINFHTKQEDFVQFLKERNIKFSTCTFKRSKRHPGNHSGMSIIKVENKVEAKKLSELNGIEYHGRNLYVEISGAEEEEQVIIYNEKVEEKQIIEGSSTIQEKPKSDKFDKFLN